MAEIYHIFDQLSRFDSFFLQFPNLNLRVLGREIASATLCDRTFLNLTKLEQSIARPVGVVEGDGEVRHHFRLKDCNRIRSNYTMGVHWEVKKFFPRGTEERVDFDRSESQCYYISFLGWRGRHRR